ncbi:hypothetical protein [Caldicellulosiruptor morganii]|uniref:Uncharacterized protein n=1 Tax=Caldicellulosiruptor morganii TaxID=1387555 RepID=A0ABY7BJT3_9FIRM|nr:hypothetical protein [Caldicellulosiruptor morganii]WAM32864.1 hypothetical protein OTK00_001316 [Caldicellulosiruptor morganii]
MGIILGLVLALYAFLEYLNVRKTNFLITCFSFLAISVIGLIDDVFGDDKSKGFKGHIKRLWKDKEISTGLVKMILIPIVLFLGSAHITQDIYKSFIYTILGALCINLFNLFDLRPGRCIKILFIFIVLIGSFINWIPFYISLLILLMPIFIGDIKEIYMLGDAGSNLIGYVFFLIISQIYTIRTDNMLLWITLFSALLLNLASEYISFSQVIEGSKVLKFIDELGRKK